MKQLLLAKIVKFLFIRQFLKTHVIARRSAHWLWQSPDRYFRSLPGAVLSCFAKKVPKECDWGGFELLAPASKATSPDPTRRALSRVQLAFMRL